MAKITDYPSITTIDANTILLADGSSGTGKILASDMAKYALETYAGSTLAGSAQSVKNAFSNILNDDAYSLHGGTVVAANTDLDTLTTPGNYYSWDSITIVNGPTTAKAGFTLKVEATAGLVSEKYVRQTLMYYNSHVVYERYRVASSWQEWTRYVLGMEIDRADRLYLGPDDTSIPANSDFDDYKTAGTYVVNTASQITTMSNVPTTEMGGRLDVRYILKTNTTDADGSKRLFQIFTGNNSSYPQWVRFFNGSSWFAWQKLPTRTEVDALNNKLTINGIYRLSDAASLKPLSLTVPNGSRHLLILTGPYVSQAHAVYTVSCNTSGNVYAFRIGGTDDLPDKTSGIANSLTLTSTAESNRLPTVVDVVLSGGQITIAS